MPNTNWKIGRKIPFLVRDRHGNNISFRLECRLDKGNKRFVLRWQDPTDLDPETGKKKSKTKSFKSYEEAFQRVKDFEFREDQRNSGSKQRLTFLSDYQFVQDPTPDHRLRIGLPESTNRAWGSLGTSHFSFHRVKWTGKVYL